ncbi:hypothetical protein OO185_00480 [Prosthecochloris sp. SCSIO W1102]|uniref:hypothetical protein n=1 Tax=Prosthecochloris sp. SCSIO W1102 TaxID=2992243 RepID=UPI00223CD6FD|nr:hypothetical protein [Prosthecochloris sp. SCSIO W1102]UZJ39607.1 hypothetical protein OO185_00480 [Prosthecochloris sp. SCSIO W1102]
MVTDPHLFFADVSLDLSRGEYSAGMKKLEAERDNFQGSYTFHLLLGRALKGTQRFREALNSLKTCCRIVPHNEVAWKELIEAHFLLLQAPSDELTAELEELSIALADFEPPKASETSDPTPMNEQKQPFSDEEFIPVPTESLAIIFTEQGAYKKAIKIYTDLMQLNPPKAETYKQAISSLLDKL